MKINIANKQYRSLLIMSGIANNILGYMSDMIEVKKRRGLASALFLHKNHWEGIFVVV
jgi:hypothetical protein